MDIGIIGGGPAGMSAALWLKNLGFAPFIVDAGERTGGMQNLNFLSNEWVLGQVGVTGPQLAERFSAHVQQVGVALMPGWRLAAIRGQSGAFELELFDSQGTRHGKTCAALLLATGTRYRGAEVLEGIPGIDAVAPERLAFGPFAFADLAACAGRRILVVGGGDNAFENVRLLAEHGASMDMVMRSPPRAQRQLRESVARAEAGGRCRIHHGTRIAGIRNSGGALEVVLAGAQDIRLETDRIHVLAGYEPNLGFLAALPDEMQARLERDAAGYLVVDAYGRTGAAGIYAAGDICNPVFPSVVSALAQGARAAKTIEMDLRNLS